MNLHKDRTFTVDNFTVRLEGDGDHMPYLSIAGTGDYPGKGGAYADSDALRRIGKKLIKWAKKLDKDEASI
jgi:hypothetical protein